MNKILSRTGVKELRNAYPKLKWKDGKLLNTVNRNAIQNWVNDVIKSNDL